VPLIPAVDTYLVERMGFRPDVARVPCYQAGCAGGIWGLNMARLLTATYDRVLVVSTELCSLVFQPRNQSRGNLVGAAIFGDGSAAAVVTRSQDTGMTLLAHQSHLLPGTRYLMGYDIEDTGAHLRLDKELPSKLVDVVPGLVNSFLEKHGLSKEQVSWWLFHPGGTKILSFLDEVLALNSSQSVWSGEVLRTVGNLSSATILIVIERFLQSKTAKPGDLALVMGIGPGLTIELMLARVE
jgi:alkylresorcinol/alkylpyrone synthase